jgi:hypothetical protein
MQEYTVKVYTDGSKFWRQNGKLSRLDGPAIEHVSGHKEWYQNDKLHRLDGPAFEDADGGKSWYIDGKRLTEEEFNDRTSASTSCRNKVEVTLKDVAKVMNIDVDKLRIKEL